MSKVKYITGTAIMLALLVSLQAVTGSLGQLVTGSCVNFVLAVTVLVLGLASGLTLAVLSPFFAFFLGIGPAFLPLVPGIALGNATLVTILFLHLGKQEKSSAIKKAAGVLVPAACKFAVLFLVVVKLILPLMNVNAKQAAAITASFSWPQLITAFIGTSLAVIVCPRLKKLQS